MRLTLKLVSVLTVLAIVLVGINGYLTVQREVDLFEAEMRANHHRLATAMEEMVVHVWRATGQGQTLELITRLEEGQQSVRIRWVWLDGRQGEAYRPRVSGSQLARVTAARREVSIFNEGGQDSPELLTYYPIQLGSDRFGALELSESLERRDAYTRDTLVRTLGLMLGLILLSVLIIGLIGVRMVGRPLEALTAKARRVGWGDTSGPIHLAGRDELTELGEALNEMCDRLDLAQQQVRTEEVERLSALEQLRHADRLRTVGRLAAGVAHELGTPLNVVSGRAGMIASGRQSEAEVLAGAQAIKSEAERMTRIIRQLLDFARRNTPKRAMIELRTVIEQTLALLEPLAHKREGTLSFVGDTTSHSPAMVDAGQLQQVLSNLVVNALQSRSEGVTVEVSLRTEHATPPTDVNLPEGLYYCLDVRDNGEGIPPEVREHLFEPFFTTKGIGDGSGLGLSIAFGIVAEHGGWIGVTSEVGHGSCFSVYLPQEPVV